MARIQIALNVSDLESSVAFYTALFGVQPHKRRPGYANFAVSSPPLKLVLIETAAEQRGHGTVAALNHLGVEVETEAEVGEARDRFAAAGLAAFDENDTTCCYALQDKVWVHDPHGAPWEVYTIKDDDIVVDDSAGLGGDSRTSLPVTVAAASVATSAPAPSGSVCCGG
ncbi:MAG: ArsI/CadI family heavy metal resistance metalloenzyme [Dermatophilaceae bacterium]